MPADGKKFADVVKPGNEILDDVQGYIKRFVSFPDEHCLIATALWAAHTHMSEFFYTTPRLALLSPEPESGKTRVLEVLDLLVANSSFSLSASPAAIFRKLHDAQITLLVDECDTVFTKRGKEDTNEDLRALLNGGYKRGATIPRCVGPKHEVVDFPIFCSAALAGLGDLPETIMSRSVAIRMRRRAPHEIVESFRDREQNEPGAKLRIALEVWGRTVGDKAGAAWPELPPGIADRAAEVWEPLIAVADAAGGDWPAKAREACTALAKSREHRTSLGVRLLADLRIIYKDSVSMATKTILAHLVDGQEHGLADDAPWAELHSGKPLNGRGLASMLKKYGVSPKTVRIGKGAGDTIKGYSRADLADAWARYLPAPTPGEASQASQASHEGNGGVTDVTGDESQASHGDASEVTDVTDVTDVQGYGRDPDPEAVAV